MSNLIVTLFWQLVSQICHHLMIESHLTNIHQVFLNTVSTFRCLFEIKLGPYLT